MATNDVSVGFLCRWRIGGGRPPGAYLCGVRASPSSRQAPPVLRPHVAVPADQAWFWTERWQQLEREADYQRLTEDEREAVRGAARTFNVACDRFDKTRDPSPWPANSRVKAVVNAPGVFEMTWSFSLPDGRATWEWTDGRQRRRAPAARGALAKARQSRDLPGAVTAASPSP